MPRRFGDGTIAGTMKTLPNASMDSKGNHMLYLSQMLGKPVVDSTGEKIGTISDLAISTGEVFPRITSLAFQGPGKIPFMISWR